MKHCERNKALERAVRLLRATELGPAYAQAWQEWEAGGDSEVWESVSGDGLETGEAD